MMVVIGDVLTVKRQSAFKTGAKSKITLQKCLLRMHWWSPQYSVKDATAIQIYAWLRDVCSYRLCTIDPPKTLGGQGAVVAIDESLFSHKPKVVMKIE